jgi:hypothetical protein
VGVNKIAVVRGKNNLVGRSLVEGLANHNRRRIDYFA